MRTAGRSTFLCISWAAHDAVARMLQAEADMSFFLSLSVLRRADSTGSAETANIRLLASVLVLLRSCSVLRV